LLLRGFSRAGYRPASRQNAIIATGLAVVVALAGAVLWGLVAMLFNLQLSLIGLLIGAGVGAVVAKYRAGHLPTIIAGAVIAVAGCALGTLLAMVFRLLNAQVPLSYILGHLTGRFGLFHYYPSEVGGLGLLFWAIAAFVAVRVPLQSQRVAASAAAMTPVWGQTPSAADPDDSELPPQPAQPMFIKPPEPEPGPQAGSSTAP
jgi:hypothetical protein